MPTYYVNNQPQPNGDHEVHVAGCAHFPGSWMSLGDHARCATAVAQANHTHRPANGCIHCCRACHSG